MNTVLLVSLLLSCVLAVSAQGEVVELQAAPQEVKEEIQAVENEVGGLAPEARFFTCPTGWTRYKNSCYLFVSSGRSWSSASAYCSSLGASLASVGDVFDYIFLQDLTRRSGNSVAWLGGFYFQGWRWVDQRPFSYNNWFTQNTVSRFQCIYLSSKAGWSNNSCTIVYPSICMRKSDTC